MLKDAFIGAEKGFGFLDDKLTVPNGLSALTAVTSLTLDFQSHAIELGWVTALSALQSFQLVAHQGVFPCSWSTMTNLRSLTVEGCCWGNQQELQPCSVFFQFAWAALTSLERLELQYLAMQGTNLSGLAWLPRLQKVSFKGLKGIDVSSCTEIAQVAFDLGHCRQDVKFSLTRGIWT